MSTFPSIPKTNCSCCCQEINSLKERIIILEKEKEEAIDYVHSHYRWIKDSRTMRFKLKWLFLKLKKNLGF